MKNKSFETMKDVALTVSLTLMLLAVFAFACGLTPTWAFFTLSGLFSLGLFLGLSDGSLKRK